MNRIVQSDEAAEAEIRRQEDYYRALSRIARHKNREELTRELLNHLIDSDRNRMAEEKHKADLLLGNILPAYLIGELKKNGRVKPIHHDHATVLFTDFVGFTEVSRKLSPYELLRELTGYFEIFEKILARRELEKVKTIGDALLAVGGINPHARCTEVDAVLAAMEIIQITNERARKREERGKKAWRVRVALHSGPLVSGVVGHTKIAFDIWGHSVNVASRIEGVAPADSITISDHVYNLIRDYFECEHLGDFNLKGVGRHSLYNVVGFVPALRAAPDQPKVPNEKFERLHLYMRLGHHVTREDGRFVIRKVS